MTDDRFVETRASRIADTAKHLLTDTSEGGVIDPRDVDQRRFDAMFYIMRGILFELERIGDQLELSSRGSPF